MSFFGRFKGGIPKGGEIGIPSLWRPFSPILGPRPKWGRAGKRETSLQVGLVPLLRERVTFGHGPKSHQKGHLETLFLRTSLALWRRCSSLPCPTRSRIVGGHRSKVVCRLRSGPAAASLPLPSDHANVPILSRADTGVRPYAVDEVCLRLSPGATDSHAGVGTSCVSLGAPHAARFAHSAVPPFPHRTR